MFRRLRTVPLAVVILLLAMAWQQTADARSNSARWDDVAGGRVPGPVGLVVVALEQQRITVYDAKGPILRASVSSGRDGYETPSGVFTVLQKNREHYSNLYDDAAMPFMQRITWSGIALHGGPLPGYPASHGCIRLPEEFAERVFGMTKLGLRVVIARNDVAPAIASHPVLSQLIARVPRGDVSGTAAQRAPDDKVIRLESVAAQKREAAEVAARLADAASALARARAPDIKRATKLLASAEKARTRAEKQLVAAERDVMTAKSSAAIAKAQRSKDEAVRELDTTQTLLVATRLRVKPQLDAGEKARKEAEAAEAAKSAAQDEARAAKRNLWPVSIFISLKTRRLYVRQGFEPVMEFPAAITEPDRPVGTLILTAAEGGDGEVSWNAVSIDGGQVASRSKTGKTAKLYRNAEARTTSADTVAATLDRITLPQEVADLIAASVWAGSSLIISDEGPHKETGPATDFIVVMSDQPQGGLKTRRSDPPVVARSKPTAVPVSERRSSRFSDERSFRNPLGASFLPW